MARFPRRETTGLLEAAGTLWVRVDDPNLSARRVVPKRPTLSGPDRKAAKLFVFALLCFLASPVRADLRMTQSGRMSVGAPGALQTFAVWNKGQKTRYDIQHLTILIDLDKKTRTTIDRFKKTYSVDPFEVQAPMPPPGPITVTPTERRTTVAGHPARLYLWKMVQKELSIAAEIWCAEDVKRVEIPTLSGGGFDAAAQNKGIGGQPLRVKLVTRSGKITAMLTSEIYALSTDPIDDAVFAIPSGFTEVVKPEKTEIKT